MDGLSSGNEGKQVSLISWINNNIPFIARICTIDDCQSAPAHRSNIGVQPQTYSVNQKVSDVTFEYKGSLSNDILLNDVSEHQDTHINLPQHQRGQPTGRHEFKGEYII